MIAGELTLSATLVYQNERQRFYRLNRPITKGMSDLLGVVEDIQEYAFRSAESRSYKPELKEEIMDFLTLNGCLIVAVSDAHTHVERLVFPAFKISVGYSIVPVEIAGKHTFISDGGDFNAVYKDEVYLRYLAMLNGFRWGGIN